MILITLALQNPFFKSFKDFKDIRHWHGSLPFKHKFWEIEVMKAGYLFEFDFGIRTGDHAGVFLGLGLLNYSCNISYYDNRHADTKESNEPA